MADLDAAMRRQLASFHEAVAAGMPRRGWKICVNDPRAQRLLGITAPFVGALNGHRVLASGETYHVDPGAKLACEAEIAIHLDCDDPRSLAAARAGITALAPALEVVDCGALSTDLDVVVASASFHHGAVIGEARPPSCVPTIDVECPRVAVNGASVGVPDPALVPDLGTIVVHVAQTLARYGERLKAGDWILSGACIAATRVHAGDVVVADFGPLGSVRVAFAARRS